MAYTILTHPSEGSLATAAGFANPVIDNLAILKTPITDTGHLRDPGVVNVVANYTIATSDDFIFCNSSGALTLTLPTASSMTARYVGVKNTNGAGGSQIVTMATTASETIDGLASGSVKLYAGDALTFYSGGLSWFLV